MLEVGGREKKERVFYLQEYRGGEAGFGRGQLYPLMYKNILMSVSVPNTDISIF